MALILFVYGTLRRGERYHYHIEKSGFIGSAESLKNFEIMTRAPADDPQGYPVAFESGKGCKIGGELYEVDEDTLKTLDILEDYPNEYDRREYEFKTKDGAIVNALMYVGRR